MALVKKIQKGRNKHMQDHPHMLFEKEKRKDKTTK